MDPKGSPPSLSPQGSVPPSDRALRTPWAFWERYQTSTRKNRDNYEETNENIYTFNSLAKFAAVWKNTPYNSLSAFFFDLKNSELKKMTIAGEERVVEALLLFRAGIEPKWEDPQNLQGTSLICELHDPAPEDLDLIWSDLVFALIGERFEYSEEINGVRVLDRLQKFGLVKVELWIKVGLLKQKQGSAEYERNKAVRNSVTAEFFKLLKGRVPDVVEAMIIPKDHHAATV